jgi:hypothetical protein
MRTSIPTCEAKAMLMGAGAFTGRYKTTLKKDYLHAEMWDDERFRWCRLTKLDMEGAHFKNRLAGELTLTGHHGLWFEMWQARLKFVLAVRRAKCFVGLHHYKTVADGYSCRVERCQHCPKLYAYKMRYWYGEQPDSHASICLRKTRRGMRADARRWLQSWNHVDTPVKEVFGGDLSRPGIATRFWLADDKLCSEEVCTVFGLPARKPEMEQGI